MQADASPEVPHAPWRPPRPATARAALAPREASSSDPEVAAAAVAAQVGGRSGSCLAASAPGSARRARPASARPAAASDMIARLSPRASLKPKLDMGAPRGYSKQSLTVKQQAPSFTFGSSTREQANKVFVSQEHTLIAMGGHDSPGPAAYLLPPSVGGKQPDGRKPDPPVWQMAVAHRFLYGYGVPEKRPGPDTYNLPAAVGGKQPNSAKVDPPVWRFGTSTRAQARKVFVSPQHQVTDMYGMDTPGPAAYLLPPRCVGISSPGPSASR